MAGRSALHTFVPVAIAVVLAVLAVAYGPMVVKKLLAKDTIGTSPEMTGFAQGLSADGCHRDQIPLALGTSPLRQFIAADATCPAEVALFGVDQSAVLLQPSWSGGSDSVQAPTGSPRMLQ